MDSEASEGCSLCFADGHGGRWSCHIEAGDPGWHFARPVGACWVERIRWPVGCELEWRWILEDYVPRSSVCQHQADGEEGEAIHCKFLVVRGVFCGVFVEDKKFRSDGELDI